MVFSGCQNRVYQSGCLMVMGARSLVIKVSVMLVPSAGSDQDLLQVSPLAYSALLQSSAFLG